MLRFNATKPQNRDSASLLLYNTLQIFHAEQNMDGTNLKSWTQAE